MPEQTRMDGPWWWRLSRGLKEGLEMRLECRGKLSRGYPVSTGVEVPREMESMIMKVLCLLMEVWKGC